MAASPRVLIVEDDDRVRAAARMVLKATGFTVSEVDDGERAIDVLGREPFDLVVLDIMLPSMNGFDVCRSIRAESGVPIVMLTARTDTADVVAGLELGADDYLTKPFEPAELAARARAAVRRVSDSPKSRWSVHDLDIDTDSFQVLRDGAEVAMSATEFKLLVALAEHPGQVMTREVLLERVWGYDYLGDSRLVDMAIGRLRAKLGDDADDPRYIVTIRSVGYRFERV